MESKKINQLATELTPSLDDLTIIGDPSTGISKKITLSQMAALFTGTVEEYASLAAFPLVGVADTIYIATDTNILYRWSTSLSAYVELSPNIISSLVFNDSNGFDGTISLVGSTATLTITTTLTSGSVAFGGASGALSQDNTNFYWDNSNKRLGINTNVPTVALDVFGSGIIGRVNGTSTNNAFLGFASNGSNKWSIGNVQSDHRFRIYNEATTSELVSVLQTGEFGIGIANPTTKFHIDGAASALIVNLDANVSIAKSISFRSDNSNRWNIEVSGTESTGNAGMDFFLRSYSDAGALIETPLSIVRSSGVTTIKSLTLTNALSAANGGTGITSYTIGDLIYASGSTTLAKLADVATGNALISGGVGVAPSWGKIGLTTHVSGTLPVANGGTGATTFTAGRVLFGDGTSAINTSASLFWDNTNTRLGVGAAVPSSTLHVKRNAGNNTVITLLTLDPGQENQYENVGSKIIFRDIDVYNDAASLETLRPGAGSGANFYIRLRGQSNSQFTLTNAGALTLTGNTSANTTENASITITDQAANVMGKIVGYRGADGNAGNLRFYSANANNLSLTLSSSGAATFQSSVTANGISSIGQEQAFTWQRTTGSASDVFSFNADSSGAYLYNNTTAKVLTYWAEGGNTGIGTDQPSFRLHVLGTGATIGGFATTSATGGYVSYRYATSTVYGYIGNGNQLVTGGAVSDMSLTAESGNILFATSQGAERMRITSGGDIGIGRTSPLGALDVKGSVFIGNLSNNPNFGIASIGKSIGNNVTADVFEIEQNDDYGACMFSIDLSGRDVNGADRYFTGKRWVKNNGGSSISVVTIGTDISTGNIAVTATFISGNRFKVTVNNTTGQTLYCGISIKATAGGTDGNNSGWLTKLITL